MSFLLLLVQDAMNSTLVKLETLSVPVSVCINNILTHEYRQIALSENFDVCGHKQFHILPFYKLTGGDNICRREKTFYLYLKT